MRLLLIFTLLTFQTQADLEKMYADYNDTYFGNKLIKDVRVTYEVIDPAYMAMTHCEVNWCDIRISTQYRDSEVVTLILLLHEMCHVATWSLGKDMHGLRWRACIHQLVMEGAYDNLL